MSSSAGKNWLATGKFHQIRGSTGSGVLLKSFFFFDREYMNKGCKMNPDDMTHGTKPVLKERWQTKWAEEGRKETADKEW